MHRCCLPEHIQHRLTIPGQLVNSANQVREAELPQKHKKDITAQEIQQAINRCKGNKTKAAQSLGISIRTLYNRLADAVSPQQQ